MFFSKFYYAIFALDIKSSASSKVVGEAAKALLESGVSFDFISRELVQSLGW